MEIHDLRFLCRALLFPYSTAGSDVSHLVYQRMLEDKMGLTRGLYLFFGARSSLSSRLVSLQS